MQEEYYDMYYGKEKGLNASSSSWRRRHPTLSTMLKRPLDTEWPSKLHHEHHLALHGCGEIPANMSLSPFQDSFLY
jgi:hypothetical protein